MKKELIYKPTAKAPQADDTIVSLFYDSPIYRIGVMPNELYYSDNSTQTNCHSIFKSLNLIIDNQYANKLQDLSIKAEHSSLPIVLMKSNNIPFQDDKCPELAVLRNNEVLFSCAGILMYNLLIATHQITVSFSKAEAKKCHDILEKKQLTVVKKYSSTPFNQYLVEARKDIGGDLFDIIHELSTMVCFNTVIPYTCAVEHYFNEF